MALVCVDDESLHAAVHGDLEASQERQRPALLNGEPADLEHIVGADTNTILLALASRCIDHRRDDAGRLGAA
jgi:hypothetical protein